MRLRGLLGRRAPAVEPLPSPDDPGLVVVASSFDPAASDVAVVAAAQHDPARAVLVRHHLAGVQGERARLEAALDPSYRLVEDGTTLLAVRAERLDALSVARERTRMAGLAQRLGGEALGWDAWQATDG